MSRGNVRLCGGCDHMIINFLVFGFRAGVEVGVARRDAVYLGEW